MAKFWRKIVLPSLLPFYDNNAFWKQATKLGIVSAKREGRIEKKKGETDHERGKGTSLHLLFTLSALPVYLLFSTCFPEIFMIFYKLHKCKKAIYFSAISSFKWIHFYTLHFGVLAHNRGKRHAIAILLGYFSRKVKGQEVLIFSSWR